MKLPQIYRGESIGLHLSANFPLESWRFRVELFTSYLAYKVVCEYPVQNEIALPAIIEHDVLKIEIPAAVCSNLSEGILLLRIEMSSGDVVRIGTFRIAELLSINTPATNQSVPIEHQLCIVENDLSFELRLGANIALNGISPTINVVKSGDDIKLRITDAGGTKTTPSINGKKGDKGDPGPGVPTGGQPGQVLTKAGEEDYVTEWRNPAGGGITPEELDAALDKAAVRCDMPQSLTNDEQVQALINAGLSCAIVDESQTSTFLPSGLAAQIRLSQFLIVRNRSMGGHIFTRGHSNSNRALFYGMYSFDVCYEAHVRSDDYFTYYTLPLRDRESIRFSKQNLNAIQQKQARTNTSSVGFLCLTGTLGTEADNWPLVVTSSLADVQAAFELFWANPGCYRWSLTINSAAEMNPFVEEAELEPLHRDDGGLELLFTSKKSGLRYAIVLSREDFVITAVHVEYRMQPERSGCIEAGALFNPETGLWEYYGLELTDAQVAEMYARWIRSGDLSFAYHANKTMRVNFAPLSLGGGEDRCDCYYAFASSNFEVAVLPGWIVNPTGCFYNCYRLKEVHGRGIISGEHADFVEVWGTDKQIGNKMFRWCPRLEWVSLHRIHTNWNFSDSPNIRVDCLLFIIQNAANSSAITISVHPEVYARLTDPANAEWYAVNEQATAKNIAFATV